MDDPIQFGELKQKTPETLLPPDRDDHFATVRIGDTSPGELRIYVDLDVYHELENHSVANTRLELGGVLLGKQALDEQGIPLVLISDSLRAEHYEATRGSFKFTHSTWSEITRRRARMNDSLHIVGWYHTHPGWGVFLSGMDDFICQNFFNAPLDVALVIDPCQGTRGWFQWSEDRSETRLCKGFFLFAGRHRALELKIAANQLNPDPSSGIVPLIDEGNPVMQRPSPATPKADQTVQFLLFWLAGLQTIVLAMIAWKIFAAPGTQPVATVPPASPAAESIMLQNENRIYRDLAHSFAEKNGSTPELVDQLATLRTSYEIEHAASLSHIERIRNLESSLTATRNELDLAQSQSDQLRQDLELKSQEARKVSTSALSENLDPESFWYQRGILQNVAIGVLAILAGLLATGLWIVSKRKAEFEGLADENSLQCDFRLRPPRNSSDPADGDMSQTDSKNFAEFKTGSQSGLARGE